MQKTLSLVLLFLIISCNSTNHCEVCFMIGNDTTNTINVLDSLPYHDNLGELNNRIYRGIISRDKKYTLIIHNYQYSGDGVFHVNIKDQSNQNINYHGRLYTLRGDAENDNATVYQLTTFKDSTIAYFRLHNTDLQLLNNSLTRDSSLFKNVLTLQL